MLSHQKMLRHCVSRKRCVTNNPVSLYLFYVALALKPLHVLPRTNLTSDI